MHVHRPGRLRTGQAGHPSAQVSLVWPIGWPTIPPMPVLSIAGKSDDVCMRRTVLYHIQAKISEPADMQARNAKTLIERSGTRTRRSHINGETIFILWHWASDKRSRKDLLRLRIDPIPSSHGSKNNSVAVEWWMHRRNQDSPL